MKTLIDLPVIGDQTEFNLRRWDELCADPFWVNYDGKFETDRFGGVVMNPPAEYSHGGKQADFVTLFVRHLPEGRVSVECPISTEEGVKVADVAWVSRKRLLKIGGRVALKAAPEICIEVLSPSNTRNEMEERRQLYFDAGAKEVWFCDQKGKISFFLKSAPTKDADRSALCPEMPKRLEE